MKNLLKLLMAGVLLTSVSCVQDITEDLAVGVQGGAQEFTVGIDQSRVVLGDKDAMGKYPLYWSNGDKISINGIVSSGLKVEEGELISQANFTVTPGEDQVLEAPFKVLYPGNANDQVVFKTIQNHTIGTFENGTTPMYGYSEASATLTLKNLAGAVKIGVKGEEGVVVTRVLVESTDGQPVAGTFDVDYTTGALTATNDISTTAALLSAEGVALVSDAAQYFYIALPAGEYAPLNITIVTAEHGTMHVAAKDMAGAESFSLAAGEIKSFNELTYSENATVFEIFDVEGLFEFANMVKAGTFAKSYDKAALGADIYAASGSSTWTPLEGFNGVFDGRGFTIYDLPAPMFGETAATISNLTLAAPNIYVSDLEAAGAFACRLVGLGSLNKCHTETFEVDGVKDGSITFAATYNAENPVDFCFGGLVGVVGANASVNECSAGVPLNFTGCEGGVVRVGGLIGGSELGATISKSVNNAAITLTGECSGYFGGIAGKAHVRIVESENKGAITFDNKAVTSQQLYVGGIVGENTNSYIEFCKNDAPITLNGTVNDSAINKEFYVGGLLGRYGRDVGSASVAPRDSENTANGDITIGGTITLRECTPAAGKTGAYATTTNHQCWGGLFGRANQNGPARCINRGDLVVNATFTNEKSYMSNSNKNNDSHLYISPWIGGIYGHGTVAIDAESANYGTIAWESDCNFNIVLGGIVGRASTITQNPCKNYGTVKFDAETTGNVHLGGFCGISMQAHKNIENYGTIEFAENAKAAIVYIAGLAGSGNLIYYEGTTARSVHYGITNGKNYGKVALNGDTTGIAYIAGICGYVGNAAFDGCQNLVSPEITDSGTITLGATANCASKPYIGGIIAYSNSTAAGCKVTNCQNDGTLSLCGTAVSNSYIGGITGLTLKPSGITACRNNGHIILDGVNTKDCYIGGIIGYSVNGSTITDVHNRGDITVVKHTAKVNSGGIGAISGANEITNSSSICNIKSSSPDFNTGMFNGYAATPSRKVSNSQVGGTIQRAGDEAPVTITTENFKNYLFSGNASYIAAEGTNYENITVVDPNATPETPNDGDTTTEEPETPAQGEQTE